MKPNFDLKDKVAVITGGGGALGSCIAQSLAESGVKIAILDLTTDSAKKTVDLIESKGLPLDLVESDTNRATLQALIDFRDSILNNKIPLSNVTSGANVAYAVEIGIQAMDTNKVIEWDSKKFII